MGHKLVFASSVRNKVTSWVKDNCSVSWGGSSKAIASELTVDMLVSPPQKRLAYQQLS